MKTRVRYVDGFKTEYSNLHPKGLTWAIVAPAPHCHIEHGYQLRLLKAKHKQQRKEARHTWIKILVWTHQLALKRAELARSQAAKEREENLDDHLFGIP